MLVSVQSTSLIEQELRRDPRIVSPHTRRGYLSDLSCFERWRGGQPMTRGVVEMYAVELRTKGLSPQSINRQLSAIRWWSKRLLEMAHDGNLPNVEQVTRHVQRITSVRGVKSNHKQAGQHISDEQVRTLVNSLPQDASGLRDAALFSTAWTCGLRRAEIANLRLEDLTIGECIEVRVLGKGDKVRVAYLYGSAMKTLLRWLDKRGNAPGPVFCRIRKDNRITLEPLSGEGMAHILSRRLSAVGLDFTWHDFRRTFVGRLLDSGVDLVTVQGMAGHQSASTTARYDRRGDRAKRAAAQLMELDNGY